MTIKKKINLLIIIFVVIIISNAISTFYGDNKVSSLNKKLQNESNIANQLNKIKYTIKSLQESSLKISLSSKPEDINKLTELRNDFIKEIKQEIHKRIIKPLYLFVTTIIVCFLLMGIILMQSSQTGGMGAAMGGGAMNAAFGGQGADKLLVRVTSGLAVTFMILAITIGFMGHPDSTVVSRENPTLTRNKGVGEPTLTIPVDVEAPIESVTPADDSKSE